MSVQHIGDDAALYALGALGDLERARVDAHVRTCDACARMLGQAEDDVTAIVAAQTRYEPSAELETRLAATLHRGPMPRSAALWGIAAAAAVVLGVLPSAYVVHESLATRDAMLAQSAAMDRIAASPHRMAVFHGLGDGAAATVAYGPDGSWYVVVVRNAARPMHVVWMHDGERTMLGAAVPHGDVATLYLPKSHRMDTLALMDGDRVVAQAQLAYD